MNVIVYLVEDVEIRFREVLTGFYVFTCSYGNGKVVKDIPEQNLRVIDHINCYLTDWWNKDYRITPAIFRRLHTLAKSWDRDETELENLAKNVE